MQSELSIAPTKTTVRSSVHNSKEVSGELRQSKTLKKIRKRQSKAADGMEPQDVTLVKGSTPDADKAEDSNDDCIVIGKSKTRKGRKSEFAGAGADSLGVVPRNTIR